MPCWARIRTIKHTFPRNITKGIGGNLTIRSLSIGILDQAGLMLELFLLPFAGFEGAYPTLLSHHEANGKSLAAIFTGKFPNVKCHLSSC